MTNAELRKAVEHDLEKVRIKADYHTKKIQKVMRKTNMSSFKKFFPYFSPNKNNWMYGIYITPSKAEFFFSAYYYTSKGISMVQCLPNGDLFKFNGHVFERYFERQKRDVNVPQQWIIQYMDETHRYNIKQLEDTEPGFCKVFLTVDKGACLGELDKKLSFCELKTFITPDLMRPEQLAIFNTVHIPKTITQ